MDSPKKNNESIIIRVKKRSNNMHTYSFVDISNLPLIDVYKNIIKRCQEKSNKIGKEYIYILHVIKNKQGKSSKINDFPIYNEEDWKDFISLNIYNMYLVHNNQLKIEYSIINLKKQQHDNYLLTHVLPQAYNEKFQSIIRDFPNENFILLLKDFIKSENLMDKCILFLENNLIKKKNYNKEELLKTKEDNMVLINQIQYDNYDKLKYEKDKIIEIINMKLDDLSNQIKHYKNFENSLIDINQNLDFNIDKTLEEQIFKTMNIPKKEFNLEMIEFPSFVKMFSEKGDFHETLVRESSELQNNTGIYMSNVINQE